MKLLVARPLSTKLVDSALGPELDYRPELASAGPSALGNVLGRGTWDGVLAASAPMHGPSFPWEVLDDEDGGAGKTGPAGDDHALRRQLGALGRLERLLCRRRSIRRIQGLGGVGKPLSETRVMLVGAGIVNLVTAWALVENGARVEVVDAGPDPRSHPSWLELGATHGGANARMVSAAEGTCFNLEVVGAEVLRRTAAEGGWLLVPPEQLEGVERRWVERFETLPGWRTRLHAEDVHRFNLAGAEGWRALRRRAPELFRGVGLVPGVLYLASDAGALDRAETLQRRLGALQRRLGPTEVARAWPSLVPAVASGELAGGLEIEGFSLALHRLVDRLLEALAARGVSLHWGRMARLVRDASGRLCRVEVGGESSRADHVVVSPGAHGEALLEGSRCQGRVQGVLGLWLELPELRPGLGRPLKIHREGHVGETSNVLPVSSADGRRQWLLGAGYGYLGRRPVDPSNPQLPHLYAALEETARRFLPRAWARALAEGTLHGERRACLRPFTDNGLGLFEVEATRDGGLLILTTGHNTGGFTQAPAVAEAVVSTLSGEQHPMAALYDPERDESGVPPQTSPVAEDVVRITAP